MTDGPTDASAAPTIGSVATSGAAPRVVHITRRDPGRLTDTIDKTIVPAAGAVVVANLIAVAADRWSEAFDRTVFRFILDNTRILTSGWVRNLFGEPAWPLPPSSGLSASLATIGFIGAVLTLGLWWTIGRRSPQVLVPPVAGLTTGTAGSVLLRTSADDRYLSDWPLGVLIGAAIIAVLVYGLGQTLQWALGGSGTTASASLRSVDRWAVRGAVLGALVFGTTIGKSYWGGPIEVLTTRLPQSKVDELRLESPFPAGVFPYLLLGGGSILAAAAAIVLLLPPWKHRASILLGAAVTLAVAGWIATSGFVGTRVESATAQIQDDFVNERPSDHQMGSFCAWFTSGRRPQETVVLHGTGCAEADIYQGQTLVDTTRYGFRGIGASGIYRSGIVLQVANNRGVDFLQALEWDGRQGWRYSCGGGVDVEIVNFSGSGGRESSERRDVSRPDGVTEYVEISCGSTRLSIDAATGNRLN